MQAYLNLIMIQVPIRENHFKRGCVNPPQWQEWKLIVYYQTVTMDQWRKQGITGALKNELLRVEIDIFVADLVLYWMSSFVRETSV